MPGIPCFFLEPTGNVRLYLRRLHWFGDKDERCEDRAAHDASVLLCDAPEIYSDKHPDRVGKILEVRPEQISYDDPRWPTKCERCDFLFLPEDHWLVDQQSLYRRLDTGEVLELRAAPIGAMWFCDWMLHEGSNCWRGPDGHSLCVRVPGNKGRGHDWLVDGQCNNCTLPDDNAHRCWIRHGDIRTGKVTVDKNGLTCSAGGGSIQTSDWHGFLRDGQLVEC